MKSFSMPRSGDVVAHLGSRNWVYASLTVVDGVRRLKPSHVASDRVHFTEPPRLTSSTIQVILRNGDEEERYAATVLPHEPDAVRIPIRLMTAEKPG
jgi:hypothetical protein